jgi:hypothetical protein
MDDIGGAGRCCCSAVVVEGNRTRKVGTLLHGRNKTQRDLQSTEGKLRGRKRWSPKTFSHSVATTSSIFLGKKYSLFSFFFSRKAGLG